MKRKVGKEAVTAMTGDELARATAEFDQEFIADSFKAPDAAARARWRKAKAKRGRPTLGRGVKVISVSVEKSLLTRVNKLAKKLRVSRANLISRGLQAVLAEEDQKPDRSET